MSECPIKLENRVKLEIVREEKRYFILKDEKREIRVKKDVCFKSCFEGFVIISRKVYFQVPTAGAKAKSKRAKMKNRRRANQKREDAQFYRDAEIALQEIKDGILKKAHFLKI